MIEIWSTNVNMSVLQLQKACNITSSGIHTTRTNVSRRFPLVSIDMGGRTIYTYLVLNTDKLDFTCWPHPDHLMRNTSKSTFQQLECRYYTISHTLWVQYGWSNPKWSEPRKHNPLIAHTDYTRLITIARPSQKHKQFICHTVLQQQWRIQPLDKSTSWSIP